jgi:hypothetical protein
MAQINSPTTGDAAEVSTLNELSVVTSENSIVRMFSENDDGGITGVSILTSPESDIDYRLRVSQDLMLDEEVFNYTAQNTGKHNLTATTMAATWTAGQFTTNSGNITTTTTGLQLRTYAYFPTTGTTTLSADVEIGFTQQPAANVTIDFGFFLSSGANPFAPTDGVFIRLNSAGLQGIVSSNTTETSTGVFPQANGTGTWTYTNNKKYQFIIYVGGVIAEFWVNSGDGEGAVLLGKVELPAAQGRMNMASALPFAIRQAHVGAAGAAMSAVLGAYNIRQGGAQLSTSPSTAGVRMLGAYQGLSGGTMGSLASYANSANPTAAVPTNTTAALGTGLGGQFWETATLALNTDGVIMSYQVPAGTVAVQGRRLVIRGIGLTSYIQTVIAGGPFIAQWSLAFGHTTVSLATGEAATTKAPRRIALSAFTQAVTAAQAVSTIVSQPGGNYMDFGDAPIYVNPGEFVALVTKHVGTVGTSGTIAHVITMAYGWE